MPIRLYEPVNCRRVVTIVGAGIAGDDRIGQGDLGRRPLVDVIVQAAAVGEEALPLIVQPTRVSTPDP